MSLKPWLDRIFRSVPPTGSNPELATARCAALSRLIPLMYFILVVNGWVLAATFLDSAPRWLTVHVSLLLTVICTARILVRWRMRNVVPTIERAERELRRTNVMAGLLSIAFPAWAFALFPHGDAFAQGHVALFLTISLLGTMFCLIHLPSAALLVAAIGGGALVIFSVSTGIPTLVSTAINITLVVLASVIVILIQSRDFTRMVNAQTEARRKAQEQTRLLQMIDDMPVAVMTVEPDTLNINYVNETSKRLVRSIEHLLPRKVDNLLGTSIDVFHQHPEHQRRILSDPANLPHKARIKLGPEVLDLQVSAVRAEDGSYIGPMLTWEIVTKEVEAENRILQLARFDSLTGLANRNTFHERLTAHFACADKRAGLLFIDLDGFKLINDTRGHYVGDALLMQVADRLRAECLSPRVTIGRLGGDEFAVLIPYDEGGWAEILAGSIIRSLSAPYRLDDDRQIRIGASVGIALSPVHGEDAGTLLARADMALYAAKAAGKGTFKVFRPEMEARIQERVRLETKLSAALQGQEGLFVFYQPIVDIRTGRVTAREALVRWHNPQRGWISPAEFVPVAEESGLIEQLGLFVLKRACQDATRWKDGARVAVNISACQLGKGTLASCVLSALIESGLPPEQLEIEVTETALLAEERDGIADLRRLRDMGVRVALDDFGTGYSSLSHLRAFPFDKIKIDGSFVKDAVERPDCAAVVKAIADLGKRLGVTTVAEGVETQAQLECATAEGCSEVQGFLLGPPMPSEDDAPAIGELPPIRNRVPPAYRGASVI